METSNRVRWLKPSAKLKAGTILCPYCKHIVTKRGHLRVCRAVGFSFDSSSEFFITGGIGKKSGNKKEED